MSKEKVQNYLDLQVESISALKNSSKTLIEIYETIINARDKNMQIFVMGNGGSASTASHFVSDLLKTSITNGNNRFKAMSLSDNIPVLLAWSNDVSYDTIFSGQLDNFVE